MAEIDVGGIAPTLQVAGQATAPGANGAVATLTGLPAGVYSVLVQVGYGTTGGAINDMQLAVGTTVIGALYVIPVANSGPTSTWLSRVVVPNANGSIEVQAVAGAAGVYNASITATRLS